MFRKHAYRGWRKKRLDSAWSRFDTALLKQLLSDNDIDSINFMMAAHLKKRKDTLKKRPFVIVRAMPKKSAYYALSMKGKKILMANAAFFAPLNICPPPDRGCRISQKPNTATLQPDPH